jgi:hypothetical protein
MMRSGEPDGGGLEDLDVYGHVHTDCACSQLELLSANLPRRVQLGMDE